MNTFVGEFCGSVTVFVGENDALPELDEGMFRNLLGEITEERLKVLRDGRAVVMYSALLHKFLVVDIEDVSEYSLRGWATMQNTSM